MKNIFKSFALFVCTLIIASCTSSSKLEFCIGAASAECPMVVDEYTICNDIYSENNNVVYNCVVDERDFIIADINTPEGRSAIKDEILVNVLTNNDEDIAELIRLVKEAKYNLIYRYVGASTGDSFDITIYNHEL